MNLRTPLFLGLLLSFLWIPGPPGWARAGEPPLPSEEAVPPPSSSSEGPPDQPPPWMWLREQLVVGGWPTLVQSETRLQGRMALKRSSSLLFRNTYAGAGGVLAVSPAYLRVGPRLSIQPLDVFELEVQGDWSLCFPMSSGLLPYDTLSGKLNAQREAREDEAPLGQMWSFTVSPTVRLKGGPVVVLANLQVTWVQVVDPDEDRSTYVYDVSRDLIIERKEMILQQQYALLGELLPGGDRVLLRAGAVLRHRVAVGSGDLSLVIGAMVMMKPRPLPAWPTFILQILPYVREADRVGTFPQILGVAQWEISRDRGGKVR